MAAQVPVQQSVVAAYAAAKAADASLGTETSTLAAQAAQQLNRLKLAAPGSGSSRSASSSKGAPGAASSGTPSVPPGQDPRAWLRGQVSAAADSHAQACLAQTGARAALLGSIAAGLRGQADQLD
jgi:hypothetical protein